MLPYLWAKVRENHTVTNQNQPSNGLPVCTENQSISAMYNLLDHFACGLLFFEREMDTSFSRFTVGAPQWKPTASGLRERSRARVQFAAGLPKETSNVDFGIRSQSPLTNPAFFFPKHVGSGSCWRTGNEEQDEGKQERGKKQPRGWRNILYACALKHKVCGQLLKDFSGESRLSTESIE